MDCPYIDMNLPRCSGSLNISQLSQAYELCSDHYELCPLYIELSQLNPAPCQVNPAASANKTE